LVVVDFKVLKKSVYTNREFYEWNVAKANTFEETG